ncbi:MAG: carbamoyltransferase C-terminal domain-containing protein [Lentimicrobium sp.]
MKQVLDPTKDTIGIYGIKDYSDNDFPGSTHDHNITIMRQGKIISHLQLERLTRKKYDHRLDEFIEEILNEISKVTEIEKCDWVFVDSFAGRSFISANGKIRFEASNFSKALFFNLNKGAIWLKNHEFHIKKEAYIASHETAHIASCLPFFGDFKENSLLIHFDGGASLSNFSVWEKRNNCVRNLKYSWQLYKIAALFHGNPLAFNLVNCKQEEVNSVAGKLMGFSSIQPVNLEIHDWLASNDFFFKDDSFSSIFINEAKRKYGFIIRKFDTKDTFLQQVGSAFQHEFETIALKELIKLQNRGNWQNLYITGGCLLNIIFNSKLINENLFQNIFIPPCCNDTGLSIGAASLAEYLKGNQIEQHSPFLNNYGLINTQVIENIDVIKNIASLINQGEIIAIANGFGEVGPRALGNRSLIGRPDSIELKIKLSEEIKGREWYRPVAPIMLIENVIRVTGMTKIPELSRYMLMDFKIKPEFVDKLKAVLHFNNTSRIQTIFNKQDNPFMFRLLNVLQDEYDMIALMNTSFNYRGEPIVHTPENALYSAKKMNLNYIVIDGKLIKLK